MNRGALLIKAFIGILALVIVFFFVFSWQSVGPNEEGFLYKPNDGGIDPDKTYYEGSYFIAPWNQMLTYDISKQSKDWVFEGKDKNGESLSIWVKFEYSVKRGEAAELHLNYGPDYEGFVIERMGGVVKNEAGNRDKSYFVKDNFAGLNESMTDQMSRYMDENHLKLYQIKITSVDL